MQNVIWGLFLVTIAYDYLSLKSEPFSKDTKGKNERDIVKRKIDESQTKDTTKSEITHKSNTQKQSTKKKKVNDTINIFILYW